MSPVPLDRPQAREAGPELLVLQRFEETTRWLLEHTNRWSKSARFTLTQRVQNHALDLVEMLVAARYEPADRRRLLRATNLRLERMRFLLRLAHGAGIMPAKGFERAMEEIDEVGRMIHGWRVAIGDRREKDMT